MGKAVPNLDGVREGGSLVDLGSGIRYKVVEYTTSIWYEVSDLVLHATSTAFQICRDGSSLV